MFFIFNLVHTSVPLGTSPQPRDPSTGLPLMLLPAITERSVSFQVGELFYRSASRIIRDLGVLALAVYSAQRGSESESVRVLDAMSGSGVRSLRYLEEARAEFVHANDLMLNYGDHPLRRNLEPHLKAKRAVLTAQNAVDLYMEAHLSGERYDLVDCDAFGTGQPHTADAWWAVKHGGLLYLCATDSLATAGANPAKAYVGYGAVAKYMPACNEVGLRLLVGTSFREAAARGLHAQPLFAFFHRPSSSFRVMMRLRELKAPKSTLVERRLQHVARCAECGEHWRVPSTRLGEAHTLRRCEHTADASLAGPMWVGPIHDGEFVSDMAAEAARRGWAEAAELLGLMEAEASAQEGSGVGSGVGSRVGSGVGSGAGSGVGSGEGDAHGALLFYHLGEVQRSLAFAGLRLPPIDALIKMLHGGGYTAARSHTEKKANEPLSPICRTPFLPYPTDFILFLSLSLGAHHICKPRRNQHSRSSDCRRS